MTQAAQKRVLEQYYAATAAGEFLDVSKITATGTGTKRQKTPANGWAGTPTKKAIRPLQVLSDNFPAYKLAIELMGAEPDYITEFKKLYGEGYVNAAPAPRSPAVKAAPVAIASLGTRPVPEHCCCYGSSAFPRHCSPERGHGFTYARGYES